MAELNKNTNVSKDVAETTQEKFVKLKGCVNSFRDSSGKWIDCYQFYVEIAVNGVLMKVKVKPDNVISKELLATELGLSLNIE